MQKRGGWRDAVTLGEGLQLGGLQLEALHERVVDLAGRRGDVLLVRRQDLVLRRQQALGHPLQDRHPRLRVENGNLSKSNVRV